MSKRIQTRADVSVIMLTALIDDDYQVLNSFLEPFDESALQRSATGSINKTYMIKSLTHYLDLRITPVQIMQRLYAYLVNENQLQQQH